ncbi:glycosyltransferase family 2 protein [Membranihabitans maritimus]|uniref:glycosyltransferase family 2 protein n=1 Tax=Membranihabitans maritimus TaxID=2904244 RepID=UPI001F3982A1|nr:glycosyltransferase [Membranihabitans maritimus]
MLNHPPTISVILPVYNGEKYLKDAIDSILYQTYNDFELIVVNDCSTDNTSTILATYSDPRLRIITNSENLKISKSLNKGIKIAKGEYIARMDADDVSHLKRFEKQIKCFKENPNFGVIGTAHKLIGHSKGTKYRPKNPEENKLRLLFHTCCTHPSVMVRKDILEKYSIHYSPEYVPAEDYHLFYTLSKHTEIFNIDEVLLDYRTFTPTISQGKYHDGKKQIDKKIKKHIFSDIGIQYTEQELNLHSKFCLRQKVTSVSELTLLLEWSNKLWGQIKKDFDSHLIEKEFQFQWYGFLKNNLSYFTIFWYFQNFNHPFLKPSLSIFNKAITRYFQ